MKFQSKILKVLNNNSLLISDGVNESIIIGKGIGYKRSRKDSFSDTDLIEKEYHLITHEKYQVESKAPQKIIRDTANIVDIIVNHVKQEISEGSIRALTNHIAAMLVRLENDEIFFNPFHHETMALYGDSYNIAVEIGKMIAEKVEIKLPESEIDFLALYIYGISNEHNQAKIMARDAIISEVSDIIEYDLLFKINKSSIAYARFVTHLKLLFERLSRDEPVSEVSEIYSIAKEYPQYMEMSKLIADVFARHLNKKLSLVEQTYIALHLARLTMKDESLE